MSSYTRLNKAVLRRPLEPKQYTSAAFADLAGDCRVTLSVGRKGQCWDNAVAESFFASLKGELTDTRAWPTRAAACRAIVEYIAWYNGTRLHSTPQPCRLRKRPLREDQECSLTELSALSVKAGQPHRDKRPRRGLNAPAHIDHPVPEWVLAAETGRPVLKRVRVRQEI